MSPLSVAGYKRLSNLSVGAPLYHLLLGTTILLSLPRNQRGPKPWAILHHLLRPQAGNWIESGEMDTNWY